MKDKPRDLRADYPLPFATDDGRSLGSGAEIPERRAKRVVGRRLRFECIRLKFLRPAVFKWQRPLFYPFRLLHPQLRTDPKGVPRFMAALVLVAGR